MSWVIVDDAVLDVGNFSRRHPGGARVIVNALGTDISNELKGDDLSIGSAMAFTPHKHSEVRQFHTNDAIPPLSNTASVNFYLGAHSSTGGFGFGVSVVVGLHLFLAHMYT